VKEAIALGTEKLAQGSRLKATEKFRARVGLLLPPLCGQASVEKTSRCSNFASVHSSLFTSKG
jgi:hypothetical protein